MSGIQNMPDLHPYQTFGDASLLTRRPPGSVGGTKGGFKIFRAEPTLPLVPPALPATVNLAAKRRRQSVSNIRARHAGARRAVPYGDKAAPDDCHLTSDA
ncbi:hypothetical protein AGMMS50289_10330 [Betaproteobacteria bacterium]|nr:hypothetical protein AGMMS50289_10330 [Betaproteobacteria bacterium]